MTSNGRAQHQRGAVTGYLLNLIRESIPATQEQPAVELSVDRATVQSWESSRRPFTAVPLSQAIAIRHKLTRLGAHPVLLAALGDAAEADFILAAVLDSDVEKAEITEHPLGWSVLTHRLTDLVLWAVLGQPPTLLKGAPAPSRRRGPVAPSPYLPVDEQRAFFVNLQMLADRASDRGGREVLLHRQACFLVGLDSTGSSAAWLGQRDVTRKHRATMFKTWSPLWPDARSVATSLAKQGELEPLRDFIARAHPDDACERAGLNYSAYWVGEMPYRQRDDSFMPALTSDWRGTRLLRHLVDRLDENHPLVDLNIHNLWALLTARRGLAFDDPASGRTLLARSSALLDGGQLSGQSQRELTSIVYSLRTDGLSGTGASR